MKGDEELPRYRIVWTRLAQVRFREQQDRLAEVDYEQTALEWGEGIVVAVEQLQTFPMSGRIVPEISRSDIRELIYRKRFRVIYKVLDDTCYILSIRRGEKLITSLRSL